MTHRADPERIYIARRSANLARLTGDGVSPERAERLVAAWEAEAVRLGLPRDRVFWERGREWMANQRR